MLEVRNASKRFGYRRVLENLDFFLSAGELVCLLGKNGAGKSTLLNCLSGLDSFSTGEMLFRGKPAGEKFGELRRDLFAIDQNYYLYEDLTLRQNLVFFHRLHAPGKKSIADVAEAADEFGMKNFLDVRMRDFSSGMKRKLRLILMKHSTARLFLLDEPFNNLDAPTSAKLERMVAEKKKAGATVLMVTHDPERNLGMCDGVWLLEQKRVRRLSVDEFASENGSPPNGP